VTRAEFLVMLVNALGLENTGGTLNFTDEDRIGAWAKEAAAVAAQLGIVNGYPDGSFRPDAPITRAEMAVTVAKALGIGKDKAQTASFTDADIPAWAKADVYALKEQGLVQGDEGNSFAPQKTATRAEAAVLLLKVKENRR